MSARSVVTALIASSLLTAASAHAQQTVPGDLSFDVPLNLTKLSPLITRVAVECRVNNAGIGDPLTKRVEAAVTDGRAVGSILITFPTSQLRSFKSGAVNYECTLLGLSTESGRWGKFDSKSAAYTVSPEPKPIVGTITWEAAAR